MPSVRSQMRTSVCSVSVSASCPDAVVEEVIKKLAGFYDESISVEEVTTLFGGG